MWRIISFVILGFWLLMSSLLVRYVWFPEGTQFNQLPPSVVLRRFLEQGSAGSGSGVLYLFRGEQRIGFVNMRISRVRADGSDYNLRLDGGFDKGTISSVSEKISWNVSLKLVNIDEFSELKVRVRLEPDALVIVKGKIRSDRSPPTVDIHWKKGQAMPTINTYGWEGVNDKLMQAVVAQAVLSAGMQAGAGQPAGASKEIDPGILRIRARESAMNIAGQKSQGYLLEFTIMDRWKARTFIAEAGEFVLMDLPEGYRIVEPIIHGLAKEYDPDKEQVITPEGEVQAIEQP